MQYLKLGISKYTIQLQSNESLKTMSEKWNLQSKCACRAFRSFGGKSVTLRLKFKEPQMLAGVRSFANQCYSKPFFNDQNYSQAKIEEEYSKLFWQNYVIISKCYWMRLLPKILSQISLEKIMWNQIIMLKKMKEKIV